VLRHGARGDADDELRADCLFQKRIAVAHGCLAVDAKPQRLACMAMNIIPILFMGIAGCSNLYMAGLRCRHQTFWACQAT
jgi:hypothetical protein